MPLPLRNSVYNNVSLFFFFYNNVSQQRLSVQGSFLFCRVLGRKLSTEELMRLNCGVGEDS